MRSFQIPQRIHPRDLSGESERFSAGEDTGKACCRPSFSPDISLSPPVNHERIKIGLRNSVADPDPGSGIGYLFDPWIRDPGSGIRDGRKSASGSGIRDEQPGSYFLELTNQFFCFFGGLKYLNSLMRIRDPAWRQFESGIEKSRIRDPG